MIPAARPLLLLDVDGVLLVVRSSWDDEEQDYAPTLHPDAAAWLAELGRSFDLCWATTWEHAANHDIGPALGLPPLPVVEFDFDYAARTPKLRSVAAWVGSRPCAWLDDDLHADAERWAAGRVAPTLLAHVDATEGMTRRHVDALLDFAARVRAGG